MPDGAAVAIFLALHTATDAKQYIKGGPEKMYSFKYLFTLCFSYMASDLQNSCVYPP
jgi:hypothetical protein